MSVPGENDSAQIQLIRSWGEAWATKDLESIAKHLHKDYRHTTYPRSLGRPENTKEESLKEIAGILKLWTDREPTIHSMIDTPGKVIVHMTNKTKTSVGVDATLESIYISHIVTDEDGSLKIKQVEEFTDSKAFVEFIQALGAAGVKQ